MRKRVKRFFSYISARYNDLRLIVATYRCETWTIKEAEIKKIVDFEMWCWRRMLRIPWTARRTNTLVWKQLDAEPMLETKIRSQRMKYSCRHGHEYLPDG